MSSVGFFFNCVPKRLHIEANVFGVVSRYFGHGGEDAFMGVQSSDSLFLAVADGVGGKARNPEMESAVFSQTLMKSAAHWLRCHTQTSTRLGRSEESANASSRALPLSSPVSGSPSPLATATSSARYGSLDGGSIQDTTSMVLSSEKTISESKSSSTSIKDSDITLISTMTEQALFAAAESVSDLTSGASTICIAEIDPLNAMLISSNLGDSGVAVFRDKSVIQKRDDHHHRSAMEVEYHPIWKSTVQERGFAIPYQLNTNSADECETAQCRLNSGDIIVIGTDGLWDNLFLHQIAGVISQELNTMISDPLDEASKMKLVKSGRLTNTLMYEALKVSEDKSRITPWSEAMTDKIDMVYSGGKIDDITCGVAIYLQ